MMMELINPVQRAEKLAVDVWDFLADHPETSSVTDADKAAIRTTAFRFSREVTPSDVWQVSKGRDLALAVIVWANSSEDDSAKNYATLKRASQRYERKRLG
jgi:hypothetical protein